ncbi:MAG: hypothetical protein JO287_24050 [Pseudonocardiales bacterium]|nr:hypothetical protein [Pseudonocardiales bacterium]
MSAPREFPAKSIAELHDQQAKLRAQRQAAERAGQFLPAIQHTIAQTRRDRDAGPRPPSWPNTSTYSRR